jgi:hypothetical protein
MAKTRQTSVKTAGDPQELQAVIEKLKAAFNSATQQIRKSGGRAIDPTTMQEIVELIGMAQSLFSIYANTFSPAERGRLIGAGIKNLGFIETAYNSAQANQQFVPSYIDLVEFRDAIDDFNSKRTLLSLIQQFAQQVSDSTLASGDVAYHNSLGYYSAVKEADRQRVPGAEAEYKLMSKYFKKGKSSKSTAQPTEAQIERDVRSLLHGTKEGRVIIENAQPSVAGGKREIVDDVRSDHAILRKTLDAEEKA